MSTLSTPSTETLDASLFGVTPHLDVLARLMILQNANGRFPIAHTKSRSERAGSTRKLTKQKGAGASRKGSNRSPSRKGGGVAFGPRSKANFQISMNASERRLGLASALSLKSNDGKIRVIDSLSAKTAQMAKTFAALEGTVLVITTAAEKTKNQGVQNLTGSHTDVVTHLSPAEVLKYDFCVFTKDALDELSTHFSN